jgi:hypothetical protein
MVEPISIGALVGSGVSLFLHIIPILKKFKCLCLGHDLIEVDIDKQRLIDPNAPAILK